MNIQPISAVKPIRKQVLKGVVTMPSSHVRDSFETEKFNLNNSIEILSKIKESNGKSKFHKGQLASFEQYLSEEPKKWNSVLSLAKNPNIKGEFVSLMSAKPAEQLDMLSKTAELKNSDGKYKYSGKDMMNYADNLTVDSMKRALPLTKTGLSTKNIITIASDKNMADTNNIAKKVSELESVFENLTEIQFEKDKYENNTYTLTAKGNNDNAQSLLLDKNLKTLAIENERKYVSKTNGNKYIQKKTSDLRNNTTSMVRLKEDSVVGRPVFDSEVKIVKDKNQKTKYYEYTSLSDVNGVLNVVRKTPDGKQTTLSSGTIDKKTGIISVKKSMQSPEGVQTDYLYENDPQGNRITEYKITDKNGNVLLNKKSTFEVINDNKCISSNGDEKFEIVTDDKKLKVKSLSDETKNAEFDFDTDIVGDKQNLIKILKKLPGEELLKLKDSVLLLNGINDPLDSYYNGSELTIETADSDFLLLHELGHAIDYKNVSSKSVEDYHNSMIKNSITMQKDVNKVFNEEKEAFLKQYPESQREHIDYFINTLTHQNGETGGLSETIAETNAVLTTAKAYPAMAVRTQYLQQNFPRTIALIANKLN